MKQKSGSLKDQQNWWTVSWTDQEKKRAQIPKRRNTTTDLTKIKKLQGNSMNNWMPTN